MRNFDENNSEKQEALIKMTRILEGFLKNEEFVPYDYDDLLRIYKVQEEINEDNILVINKIKSKQDN